MTKALGDSFSDDVRRLYDTAFRELARDANVKKDPAYLQRAARDVLDRFRSRLDGLRYRHYAILLGEGIESAGIRAGELRISPQTVRLLAEEQPLWRSYSDMTAALSERINGIMARALLTPGGFSAPETRQAIADAWDAESYRIDRIVRTESRAVVNQGRMLAYEQAGEPEWRYVWSGPSDHRTTKACLWLQRQTERRGGVTMGVLREMMEEARRRWFPRLAPREGIIHPNERHGPRKVVTARGN